MSEIEKVIFNNNGYLVRENIYTETEIINIIHEIESADTQKDTFRKSSELFAIRQFLKEIPTALNLIFNSKLKSLIKTVLGENYFIVKSIYFDKPVTSNWYVSYHQDLTISVDKKLPLQNYGPWTVKQNQFAVQPPIHILENISTIRIHLDDTNDLNGDLKIIPKSHIKQIYRPETINWENETEITCTVPHGGVMLMKPLLLHSSSRTLNNKRRRVIHIELSSVILPEELNWAEKMEIP